MATEVALLMKSPAANEEIEEEIPAEFQIDFETPPKSLPLEGKVAERGSAPRRRMRWINSRNARGVSTATIHYSLFTFLTTH